MVNKFTETFTNLSYTNNWALTLNSSLNKNVDFFFVSWTWWEYSNENEILEMFHEAYLEDKDLALKNLFHLRDIRFWKWRRRAFKIIWNKYLDKEIRDKLKSYVPEFWRYDDLLESNLDYIAELLKDKNTKNYWLLCKWIPRRSNVFFKLAKKLNMSLKDFRKLLSENTKVVETKMCNREFNTIEYSKIPSWAFKKYKEAFLRNDETRFTEFINFVNSWKEKIKTASYTPWDVFKYFFEKNSYNINSLKVEDDIIKAMWSSFDDIKMNKNFIPVVDSSWSMYPNAINHSIWLWVFLSEKNTSSFKDFVINFSERPEFIDLSNKKDIVEKFKILRDTSFWLNTNFERVFDLILNKAKNEWLKDSDMPNCVIVLSDMEFDESENRNKTNFESLRDKYKEAWYTLPELIFWNLNWRKWNSITEADKEWIFMISWFSTNSIKTFMNWWDFKNSYELMMEELNSERYSEIHS